jgi:pimeloyl-ACP methyl ester carboxylesterase
MQKWVLEPKKWKSHSIGYNYFLKIGLLVYLYRKSVLFRWFQKRQFTYVTRSQKRFWPSRDLYTVFLWKQLFCQNKYKFAYLKLTQKYRIFAYPYRPYFRPYIVTFFLFWAFHMRRLRNKEKRLLYFDLRILLPKQIQMLIQMLAIENPNIYSPLMYIYGRHHRWASLIETLTPLIVTR